MLTPSLITYAAISLFALQAISHLIVNPHALIQEPSNPNSDQMVAQRGSRAMGIFAVVLVVVNFIIDPTSRVINLQSLALVTTLISAGFLMLAFSLEVIGGLNVFLFKIQEDSLTYAGLLLFTGLYFVLEGVDTPLLLTILVLIFVILSWTIWIIYKIDYIVYIQSMEWNAVEHNRCEVGKRALEEHKRIALVLVSATLIALAIYVI